MKSKFLIGFNKPLKNISEVRDALKPYKVTTANQRGKYTWFVKIKSSKTSEAIVTGLTMRSIIRDIEALE